MSGRVEFVRRTWERSPPVIRCWSARGAAALFVLLSPILAYGLTAFHLGSIQVNSDRAAPTEGVEIFVVTFGVHADLMVPRRHAIMDWSPWFPLRDFEQPRLGDYVMLGWGDRRFFEEVREWKDLSLGVAMNSSLRPTPTLMHVANHPRPLETKQVQRVVLKETDYARMCAHLRSGFQLGAGDLPRRVPGLTYLGHDAFYEGAGSYDGITTCNEWVARALRTAGVRMGLWTPLAVQIRESLNALSPPHKE